MSKPYPSRAPGRVRPSGHPLRCSRLRAVAARAGTLGYASVPAGRNRRSRSCARWFMLLLRAARGCLRICVRLRLPLSAGNPGYSAFLFAFTVPRGANAAGRQQRRVAAIDDTRSAQSAERPTLNLSWGFHLGPPFAFGERLAPASGREGLHPRPAFAFGDRAGIASLARFDGPASGRTALRLFALTNEGIWNPLKTFPPHRFDSLAPNAKRRPPYDERRCNQNGAGDGLRHPLRGCRPLPRRLGRVKRYGRPTGASASRVSTSSVRFPCPERKTTPTV